MLDVLAVVPARFASQRFPGKPLATLAGKPMVRWVYEAAKAGVSRVIVATDDARIVRAVRGFGGEAMITSKRCRSGTDRVWEVAKRVPARLYLNIQGDEPLMSARTVQRVVALHRGRSVEMGTAAIALRDEKSWRDPNVVKVVTDLRGAALYFSRASLPHFRDGGPSALFRLGATAYKHLGIYSYTRATLGRFVKWRPSFLEEAEKLEQLRALQNGVRIMVAVTPDDSIGVDRPEDGRKVEKILMKRKRGLN